MLGRWLLRCTIFLWVIVLGPALGFILGQRLIGVDCQLSPTAGADIMAAIARARDAAGETLAQLPFHSLVSFLTPGGLPRMPIGSERTNGTRHTPDLVEGDAIARVPDSTR